jgi:Fe-S-cluster containining protein
METMEEEHLPDQKSKPEEALSKPEEPLVRLEQQVERGNLFTHTIVSRNADQINLVESMLYGLIDVLAGKGTVTQEEIFEASAKARQEMEEKGQTSGPGVALWIEGDGNDNKEKNFVPVNCAERLHICKAVCCKLHFALTAQQVESGKIKWDLGQPYYIRQEASGYCTHLEPGSRCCSVYADRPRICSRYSCAHDERIWKDFENMVLNDEWIEGHLGHSKPRLASMQMIPVKNLLRREDEGAGGE